MCLSFFLLILGNLRTCGSYYEIRVKEKQKEKFVGGTDGNWCKIINNFQNMRYLWHYSKSLVDLGCYVRASLC